VAALRRDIAGDRTVRDCSQSSQNVALPEISGRQVKIGSQTGFLKWAVSQAAAAFVDVVALAGSQAGGGTRYDGRADAAGLRWTQWDWLSRSLAR
jgi:hypothetical protein